MFRTKTGVALKEVLESQGEDMAVEVIEGLLKDKKVRPEDFSIREMWEACHPGQTDIKEALTASSFPKLTGTLINSRMIAAYESILTIGDQLVTVVPSNMQTETIAGLSAGETVEEVGEGQEYNDSTLSEKFVTIRNAKFGRRIDITEETIYFDKTGQILNRARQIGEGARQYKEQKILTAVQDLNSNVWNPSGTPVAFYSTTNGNLIASNAFGESGLEAVLLKAQLMSNDGLNTGTDNFVFIDTNNLQLLVPVQLWVEAWQMAMSTKTPESGENADNFFRGRFQPLSSPFVSNQSATTWYIGEFKKDFWWTEVWPLQTITLQAGSEMSYFRDIKASHKVRFYGGVGAVDVKHCFKCTA